MSACIRPAFRPVPLSSFVAVVMIGAAAALWWLP